MRHVNGVLAGLAIAAGAAFMTVSPASAKPADCFTSDDGNYPCNFRGTDSAGSFIATAYLRPDGRVKSAGVAPPSEAGEAASDCIVETISKLRFRSPGKRAAKVTFKVP